MNIRTHFKAALILAALTAFAAACSPSAPAAIPTALAPTNVSAPSNTPAISFTTIATLTVAPPTGAASAPTAAPLNVTVAAPTQPIGGMPAGITPGNVSGPYAVVLVAPNDVLNIRRAAGVDSPVVGTLAYNETNVTRVGASTRVGDSIWWEVQSAAGIRGWVNSTYLTEYFAPSSTCDARVMTLLDDFERAIVNADGVLLGSLVSPRHGVDVWLYRSGVPVNFDADHFRWVFDSTYVHEWGAHPASGLDVSGSFHDAVLPFLQDALKNGHEVHCNERGVSGWNISAWPDEYTNFNVYKIYKPPTVGVDLDYRIWLVGIEYVGGKPYLVALIHFIWTP